jgi:undecaprenyl-phosphate galactose phosphotransferase
MTSLDETCTAPHFETVEDGSRPGRASYFDNQKETSGAIDAKRAFDIVFGLIAIIFFLPLMAVIYLVLTVSYGNALFFHLRVGRNGVPFYCYKFRSMVRNSNQVLIDHLNNNPAAREEWNKNFKLTHDPRITWCGGFLRLTSLDELPQLFNVLKGDMSLVGPRPIVHAEIELYADKIADYYRCRPGITGLWQVSGRNLISYERRVELDSIYAKKQSLRFDLSILIRTVLVVISRRGAL